MAPRIPGFKATSELTEEEIATVREILAGRQPFSLYFNAAIKDLARGYDNRQFHLHKNLGLVMAIDFDELRVFSVVGKVEDHVLSLIAANPLRSEFHVSEAVAEKICAKGGNRLRRKDTLKYYILERCEPFEIESGGIRRLTLENLDLVRDFYAKNYDGAIFSDWMLELPFFGYFVGGELAAAGGSVVIDEAEGVANVGNFLTRPRNRGKGLAKHVTKALLNDLCRRGISTFTLGTIEENIPAWKAYESVGFSLLDRRVELEFAAAADS